MNELDEQLAEKYFSGRISPAEKAKLDARVQEDAEFADYFAFEQKTAATIIHKERSRLKEQLRQAEANRSPKGGLSVVWVRRALSAAAAVALLIIGWRLITTPDNPTSDITFVPYPNTFASAGGSGQSIQEQASQAYQAGEYAQAASLFAQLNTDAGRFYAAVSEAGNKNYSSAIPNLAPFVNDPNSEFQGPALFYTAWALYQSGDKANAGIYAKRYLATPEKKLEAPLRKLAEKIKSE